MQAAALNTSPSSLLTILEDCPQQLRESSSSPVLQMLPTGLAVLELSA